MQNTTAAIKVIASELAKQDRRVEPKEVAEAAKQAYKSAKRNEK